VRALGLALALAVGAALAQPPRSLAAQDVAARLDGRVPANVVHAVQGIAQDAQARGLPVELLIQKAMEGGAKGVPAERVIAAVQVLAARLDEARGALREAGNPHPSPEALESGAYALSAGLSARQVRDLGRVSQAPYDPALMLRVAATLTALGVPAEQGLHLMEHMIKAGREPDDLLELPNQVQVGMARGATPAEVAEGLDTREGAHDQENEQGKQGQQRRTPHKP
jgi:hypothetical protein